MTTKQKAWMLKNNGCTLKEICAILNLKMHQVNNLFYYKPRPKKEFDFDLLLSLWRSGLNYQQIANRIGVTRSRINYQFKKRGL